MRHSHASLLLEKGVNLATVSERLGHSSIATTAKIYAHGLRGKDFAAAQIWDDIKEQARGEKPTGRIPVDVSATTREESLETKRKTR